MSDPFRNAMVTAGSIVASRAVHVHERYTDVEVNTRLRILERALRRLAGEERWAELEREVAVEMALENEQQAR